MGSILNNSLQMKKSPIFIERAGTYITNDDIDPAFAAPKDQQTIQFICSIERAISSGNPKIIDKLLSLFPQIVIDQNHLALAAEMGGISMFKKLLEMNKELAITQEIYRAGVRSGNLELVILILSLNTQNSEIFNEIDIRLAISSGNVDLLEFVLINNKLDHLFAIIVNRNASNYLILAVKSNNPAMFNRIAGVVTQHENINPIGLLHRAIGSGNPLLVDCVLQRYPTLEINHDCLLQATERRAQRVNMVKRILEASPELIHTKDLISHVYLSNDIHNYLTHLLIRRLNQPLAAPNPGPSAAA